MDWTTGCVAAWQTAPPTQGPEEEPQRHPQHSQGPRDTRPLSAPTVPPARRPVHTRNPPSVYTLARDPGVSEGPIRSALMPAPPPAPQGQACSPQAGSKVVQGTEVAGSPGGTCPRQEVWSWLALQDCSVGEGPLDRRQLLATRHQDRMKGRSCWSAAATPRALPSHSAMTVEGIADMLTRPPQQGCDPLFGETRSPLGSCAQY